jgi:hypothetical protein
MNAWYTWMKYTELRELNKKDAGWLERGTGKKYEDVE